MSCSSNISCRSPVALLTETPTVIIFFIRHVLHVFFWTMAQIFNCLCFTCFGFQILFDAYFCFVSYLLVSDFFTLSLLHLLHVAYVPFNIPPSASPSPPCLCLTLCCSQRPPVSQAAKGTPLPSLQRVHDLQTQNPLLQEPKARGKFRSGIPSLVRFGCMFGSAELVWFVNDSIVFSHNMRQ